MPPKKRQDDNGRRDELSTALVNARKTAGIRQQDAGKAAGLAQNKMSRVEHGQGHLLKPDELRALLTAYGVSADDRRRIVALHEASQEFYAPARVILQQGAHHFQERLRRLTEEATLVRGFAPTAVIGYLQTLRYMETVFTQRMTREQAAPAIAKRLEQQRLLDEPNRRWVMLMTEGSLRWNLGGWELMIEQIDAILTAMDRGPHVTVGLITHQAAARLLLMNGFHINDRSSVVVGTTSGTAIIRDTAQINYYERLFGQLEDLAVYGDEARAELRRIADEYRRLG